MKNFIVEIKGNNNTELVNNSVTEKDKILQMLKTNIFKKVEIQSFSYLKNKIVFNAAFGEDSVNLEEGYCYKPIKSILTYIGRLEKYEVKEDCLNIYLADRF